MAAEGGAGNGVRGTYAGKTVHAETIDRGPGAGGARVVREGLRRAGRDVVDTLVSADRDVGAAAGAGDRRMGRRWAALFWW